MPTPIERMIDEACGFTPEKKAQIEAKRRADAEQQAEFEELFEAALCWYDDARKHHARLKRACRAVIERATNTKEPTP